MSFIALYRRPDEIGRRTVPALVEEHKLHMEKYAGFVLERTGATTPGAYVFDTLAIYALRRIPDHWERA